MTSEQKVRRRISLSNIVTEEASPKKEFLQSTYPRRQLLEWGDLGSCVSVFFDGFL